MTCGWLAAALLATASPVLSSRAAAQRSEPLLSEARVRAVAHDSSAWLAYLERSRVQRALDSAVMAKELNAVKREEMTRAPYARTFEVISAMTPAWFASDSARVMATNLLSFQAPNGGWSKHVDYRAGARGPGQSWFSESSEWQWIATIDNSSTTEQMQFLANIDSAQPQGEYKDAWRRGFRYLLTAQFPNGCWPQVWPLDGGYHDAVTFNDDATTNVLTTLQQAAAGKPAFLSDEERSLARNAVARGIECVLDAQQVVNGKPGAWGQQHDPLTLQPTSARSYEHASLTAQESANLVRFLIRQKNPSPRMVQAIEGAAAWLESHKLFGYTYDFATGRRDAPGAGPIWARMYEIETDRPLFSDRNGIKLYDWNQLNDRRTGYGWYTYAPVLALKQYEAWARKRTSTSKVHEK
ncbi:MAG TPA: pectate lyase [Gemmatimonadaceae bacterium]